ncbi:MAG TPA: uracil-DNA glycosylase [Vicinamibacterales bacterium]|nr:uracil-DNA glycosylase [Vicinamibacterales bacterium]
MTDRRALAEHLKFFQELGVTGVSRDASWRARTGDAAVPATDPAPADVTSDATDTGGSVDQAARLIAIREDLGPCTRCKLHKQGRKQIVFGVGNPNADLMFVGEAPGADEDVQGEPFVGRAGQLLTKIIESIGLQRSDVYIANVIKCRPPQNRNPEPDEVASCQPFLLQQIDTIQPRVIVALGTFAAQTLLNTVVPISRLRGQLHDFRGGAKVVPTFHPAFLLRSPDRKRDVWEDMKKVRELLARPS